MYLSIRREFFLSCYFVLVKGGISSNLIKIPIRADDKNKKIKKVCLEAGINNLNLEDLD
jgi:hypothetical protein